MIFLRTNSVSFGTGTNLKLNYFFLKVNIPKTDLKLKKKKILYTLNEPDIDYDIVYSQIKAKGVTFSPQNSEIEVIFLGTLNGFQ